MFEKTKHLLMKTTSLSPTERFELIESVIKQAKSRFEENGFAFILWGISIALCCFAQAYLIEMGQLSRSWYPYLALPLVALIVFFYYYKKNDRKPNPLAFLYGRIWQLIGLNIMILSFGFSYSLTLNLVPILLILLGIATLFSASILKSSILLFSGLMVNFSGFIAFFLSYQQQSILMGIVSIIAFLFPGIKMKIKHKKDHV